MIAAARGALVLFLTSAVAVEASDSLPNSDRGAESQAKIGRVELLSEDVAVLESAPAIERESVFYESKPVGLQSSIHRLGLWRQPIPVFSFATEDGHDFQIVAASNIFNTANMASRIFVSRHAIEKFSEKVESGDVGGGPAVVSKEDVDSSIFDDGGSSHKERPGAKLVNNFSDVNESPLDRGHHSGCGLGGVCGYSGGVSADTSGLIGAYQKTNLDYRNASKNEGEDSKPQSIIGDPVVRRFWNSTWGGACFGILVAFIACWIMGAFR
jgi:hypothetical protein